MYERQVPTEEIERIYGRDTVKYMYYGYLIRLGDIKMIIKTKDELIKHLLYTDSGRICVGVQGDSDIRDNLSPDFAKKIEKLLNKKG